MSTTIITLDPTLKRSETIHRLLSREDYVNTDAEKTLKYQDRIKLCVGSTVEAMSSLGRDVKFIKPPTNGFGLPMVTVPWKWNYYSQVFDMEFTAGIISLNYEEQTNIISPDFGWYVKDITEQ